MCISQGASAATASHMMTGLCSPKGVFQNLEIHTCADNQAHMSDVGSICYIFRTAFPQRYKAHLYQPHKTSEQITSCRIYFQDEESPLLPSSGTDSVFVPGFVEAHTQGATSYIFLCPTCLINLCVVTLRHVTFPEKYALFPDAGSPLNSHPRLVPRCPAFVMPLHKVPDHQQPCTCHIFCCCLEPCVPGAVCGAGCP